MIHKIVPEKFLAVVFIFELLFVGVLLWHWVKITKVYQNITYAEVGMSNEEFVSQHALSCGIPPIPQKKSCAEDLGKRIVFLFQVPDDQEKQCLKLHPSLIPYCQRGIQEAQATSSASPSPEPTITPSVTPIE